MQERLNFEPLLESRDFRSKTLEFLQRKDPFVRQLQIGRRGKGSEGRGEERL